MLLARHLLMDTENKMFVRFTSCEYLMKLKMFLLFAWRAMLGRLRVLYNIPNILAP